MIRPILAVLIPIVGWGILWVAAAMIIVMAMPDQFDDDGFTTSSGILGGYIAISAVLSLIAGFTCARIARKSHMKLVMILAIIQFLIGVMVQAGAWDSFPIWYHVIFLALVIPMHFVGGKIGHKTKPT